jgi:hypothetical protein
MYNINVMLLYVITTNATVSQPFSCQQKKTTKPKSKQKIINNYSILFKLMINLY